MKMLYWKDSIKATKAKLSNWQFNTNDALPNYSKHSRYYSKANLAGSIWPSYRQRFHILIQFTWESRLFKWSFSSSYTKDATNLRYLFFEVIDLRSILPITMEYCLPSPQTIMKMVQNSNALVQWTTNSSSDSMMLLCITSFGDIKNPIRNTPNSVSVKHSSLRSNLQLWLTSYQQTNKLHD